jgi:4-hydroxybenzoate polyprenyltransferase
LLGFFLAVKTTEANFDWKILGLVVLCMVFARSAAMAFNRLIDTDVDKDNPRTAIREIPAGIIGKGSALVFVVLNSLFFVAATYFINTICFLFKSGCVAGYSWLQLYQALYFSLSFDS